MKREEETTHPCYKPVRKTKKHIAEEAKRFSFLYPSESKEIFLYMAQNGQTVYAVEEQNEQGEWITLKVFTTRQAAEDERQTLEAYGKKK